MGDADIVVQDVEASETRGGGGDRAFDGGRVWRRPPRRRSPCPLPGRRCPRSPGPRPRRGSTQATFAPSRAYATAAALPLPQPGPEDPAPNTIAVFPLSRSAISVSLRLRCALSPAARPARKLQPPPPGRLPPSSGRDCRRARGGLPKRRRCNRPAPRPARPPARRLRLRRCGRSGWPFRSRRHRPAVRPGSGRR